MWIVKKIVSSIFKSIRNIYWDLVYPKYGKRYVINSKFNFENLSQKSGNIVIGDAVWIGSSVFVNPGVIIGDNSIVEANSVITKDVEPNSIIGGVPAKLIRYKNL